MPQCYILFRKSKIRLDRLPNKSDNRYITFEEKKNMLNNEHIKERRELIEKGTSNNKIIGLGFFKKDGTFRTGAFRRGVVKGITGEGLKFNPKDYNLITLYDMNAKGYRNIPIDRLKYIKARGKISRYVDKVKILKTLGIVEA